MKPLPNTDATLVFRTDFSDPQGWDAVQRGVRTLNPLFRANLVFLDDRAYEGLGHEELRSLFPDEPGQSFFIVADRTAMSQPGHPLLLVNLNPYEPRGLTFRAIPSEIGMIETNLSLGNMDFRELADAVGSDGVFRGFH